MFNCQKKKKNKKTKTSTPFHSVHVFVERCDISLSLISSPYRLGLMFCHFSVKDPLRYTTLCHRVKLAGQLDKTCSLSLNMDQVGAGCVLCPVDFQIMHTSLGWITCTCMHLLLDLPLPPSFPPPLPPSLPPSLSQPLCSCVSGLSCGR